MIGLFLALVYFGWHMLFNNFDPAVVIQGCLNFLWVWHWIWYGVIILFFILLSLGVGVKVGEDSGAVLGMLAAGGSGIVFAFLLGVGIFLIMGGIYLMDKAIGGAQVWADVDHMRFWVGFAMYVGTIVIGRIAK